MYYVLQFNTNLEITRTVYITCTKRKVCTVLYQYHENEIVYCSVVQYMIQSEFESNIFRGAPANTLLTADKVLQAMLLMLY